jgi:uncharacterized protein (TIGR03435 family)
MLAAPLLVQTLEFEVATIKPNNSGSRNGGTTMPAIGRFQGTNVTLHELVARAYGIRDFQIVGGPDWINDDRFDVAGKPPESAPPQSQAAMLRELLAQRFKLAVHKETREQPVYSLVIARPDGKLGPAMSLVDCAQKPCDSTRTSETSSGGTVTAMGMTMEALAVWASSRTDRVVIDRTGLTGNFDFQLKYTPARLSTTGDSPSIFTALQEQLGLKLESARGPVEFLVIDRAERPTPD